MIMPPPVYLDYNATTPIAPSVLEAMLPYLFTQFGNASSRHRHGRAARQAMDVARQQVAAAVGAHPTEIIFTSGGSEANNLFLKGAGMLLRVSSKVAKVETVAVSAIEHPCVLNAARQLLGQGWRLSVLPTDQEGRVSQEGVQNALENPPLRWSVMLANNETGVIQDVALLAAMTKGAGWFHTDAIQALGKIPLDFRALNAAGVHAMTVSAHKIYGPKGAGALVVDKRLDLLPLVVGGGQEQGLRSGTENVAAIVGFGAACELAAANLASLPGHLKTLQGKLEEGLREMGAVLFGAGALRLPNTTFFAFPGIDGETLVGKLDYAGFSVASGSACSSESADPSHVLLAMGTPPGLARGAVRVSLGADNTPGHIEGFLLALKNTLAGLRGLKALGNAPP